MARLKRLKCAAGLRRGTLLMLPLRTEQHIYKSLRLRGEMFRHAALRRPCSSYSAKCPLRWDLPRGVPMQKRSCALACLPACWSLFTDRSDNISAVLPSGPAMTLRVVHSIIHLPKPSPMRPSLGQVTQGAISNDVLLVTAPHVQWLRCILAAIVCRLGDSVPSSSRWWPVSSMLSLLTFAERSLLHHACTRCTDLMQSYPCES